MTDLDLMTMATELDDVDRPPIVLTQSPLDAVIVVGLLQVALTFPDVDSRSAAVAQRHIEDVLRQLADCPATVQIVRSCDAPPACDNARRGRSRWSRWTPRRS